MTVRNGVVTGGDTVADMERLALDLATRVDHDHRRGRRNRCVRCRVAYPCPPAMSARLVLEQLLGSSYYLDGGDPLFRELLPAERARHARPGLVAGLFPGRLRSSA